MLRTVGPTIMPSTSPTTIAAVRMTDFRCIPFAPFRCNHMRHTPPVSGRPCGVLDRIPTEYGESMENGLENTENPEAQQPFGSHVGMEVRTAIGSRSRADPRCRLQALFSAATIL